MSKNLRFFCFFDFPSTFLSSDEDASSWPKSPLSRNNFGKSIAGAPPSSLSSASDGKPPSLLINSAISFSIFSNCSGCIPSLPIISPKTLSTGRPNSLAHFKQSPSETFSPFSTFVTKTAATLFLHLEHITIFYNTILSNKQISASSKTTHQTNSKSLNI